MNEEMRNKVLAASLVAVAVSGVAVFLYMRKKKKDKRKTVPMNFI